jgi:hypothetical protein
MATQFEVVTALSDAERLRHYARICAVPEGVATAELGGKRGLKDLAKLVGAGLVVTREGRCHAVMDAFRNLRGEQGPPDLSQRGRMVTIPRNAARRLELLKEIAGRLEHGRVYPEAELRDILTEFSPDHAALRRYLVESGLLSRDSADGTYWLP